jgi:UDP-2,4-diacetamido-2,4,6-trideoxy-beta-L-altropyranose hydrolase
VRGNSFNASPIQPDSHRQWFYSRLKNLAGCKLYIAETQDSLRIGQVRFERGKGEDWQIHYGLWVGARGKDLGVKVVQLALEKLRAENPLAKVIGYVKPDNAPSKRVFETLGFSVHQQDTRFVYTLNFESNNLRARAQSNS